MVAKAIDHKNKFLRNTKWWILPGIGLAFLLTNCLADIRPEKLKQPAAIDPVAEEKGRALLESMASAHGGREAWLSLGPVAVTLTDKWYQTIPKWFAMPWEENGERVRLEWLPASDDSRLTFLENDHRGSQWGIQNWATYEVPPPDNKIIFEQDSDIKFWLPTMEYFIEAPFRLGEADVVAHAGRRTLPGAGSEATRYDVVFLSWKKSEPQKKIDQYQAWINTENNRLEYLYYTVRDMAPFITGCAWYRDFREVSNGVTLAQTITIVSEPGADDVLHEMKLEKMEFQTKKAPEYFRPDPSKGRTK